jgi:hypothetical protein
MVITPNDISSLFQQRRGEQDRYADAESQTEELDELALGEEADAMDEQLAERRRTLAGRLRAGAGERTGTTDGGAIPQWLRDADRAGRLARKGGPRKGAWSPARDWRVWAGLIAAVGFAAAFANVYHATGGFGSDHASVVSAALTREPLL